VPDFLCQKEISSKEINLVWEGKVKTENTLYFASRTDLKYKKELEVLRNIFTAKMK
jgi:hypothetical protein